MTKICHRKSLLFYSAPTNKTFDTFKFKPLNKLQRLFTAQNQPYENRKIKSPFVIFFKVTFSLNFLGTVGLFLGNTLIWDFNVSNWRKALFEPKYYHWVFFGTLKSNIERMIEIHFPKGVMIEKIEQIREM